MSSPTILSSSNNVIPFEASHRPEERKGFAQAREEWLSRWHADRRLTHSERALCTQIYLHFNYEHFEKTGDLLAWPSWETLMAGTGLSKTSVFRRLRCLEQLGAFEVEHGRYDHKTKKRAGNRYLVRESKVAPVQPRTDDQGCTRVPNQGCSGATRLDDSDSVNLRGKKDSNRNSRGPKASEKDPKPMVSDSSKPSSDSEPCDVPRGAPANGGGGGGGGGGGRRYVAFDDPDWELVERWERGLPPTKRPTRDKGGGCWLTDDEWRQVLEVAVS